MHRIVPFAALVLAAAACAAPSPKSQASAAAAPSATAAPVATAAAAPAAAPAPAAAAPALPTGKTAKLAGVVAAVDAAAGTVSLKAHGKTRVLRVAQGAKLTKGGDWAAISLSDVVSGDHLSVSYAGDVLASLHVKVTAGSSGQVAKSK